VAWIEATTKGTDVGYVVTSLKGRPAKYLYKRVYCRRGQAENLIKRHETQLSSDRTSCRSPLSMMRKHVRRLKRVSCPPVAVRHRCFPVRLVRTVRNAIPKTEPLASVEFSTIRLRLLKIAVRVREPGTRIRLALAANCGDAALFRDLIGASIPRPM